MELAVWGVWETLAATWMANFRVVLVRDEMWSFQFRFMKVKNRQRIFSVEEGDSWMSLKKRGYWFGRLCWIDSYRWRNWFFEALNGCSAPIWNFSELRNQAFYGFPAVVDDRLTSKSINSGVPQGFVLSLTYYYSLLFSSPMLVISLH